MDDAEAARGTYQRAFDVHPESPEAASRLVELLGKAEAWSDLERFLERARVEGPLAERPEFQCREVTLVVECPVLPLGKCPDVDLPTASGGNDTWEE